MAALGFILLIVVCVIGICLAIALSPAVEWVLGFIWSDPTRSRRASVSSRVKELCVDGNIPEETAILMVSKEKNLMEEQVKDILGSVTPAMLRAATKGSPGAIINVASANLLKKLGGK